MSSKAGSGMDSGRFLLAVVLMVAVMVLTNILLPPPTPPEGATGADSSSVATDTTTPAAVPQATSAPPALGAPADSASAGIAGSPVVAEDTVVVTSGLYRYAISTRGAAILDVALLDHPTLDRTREGEPVQLAVDSLGPLFGYRLRTGTRDVDLSSLSFTPSAPALDASSGSQTLELTHSGQPAVTVAYTFHPDRYSVDARILVTGTQVPPVLHIGLPGTLRMNEATNVDDARMLAFVVNNEREGINRVRLASVDEERVVEGPLYWAAVKNKYFVAAALMHPEAQTRFGGVIARPLPAGAENAANLTTTLAPAEDGTFGFRIFAGPQEPDRLKEIGWKFEDVNPFGWRIFRPILTPLGHGISWALYGMKDLLGVGYGWVLILFGVLIRLLMWPLNAKAMRSQMKNMEIQPRMKEIQAKYKNNPELMQKELLKLYREEGFNPMSGCAPMLLPMPILITLFFVFQSTIAFRGVEFLWLPDLSQKDPLYILPIVMGLSMYAMQWLSSRSMTEQNPQMKFMMYAMPAIMTVIFLNFASGLNLYYAAMNIASIPQQIQITRERKAYMAARGRT